MKYFLRAFVIISFGFSSACAAGEKGQVVDKKTGAGIGGALVTVLWRGRAENPVQGNTFCYSIAVVAADDQGRFELPDRAPDSAPLLLSGREKEIHVYAPGYEEYPVQRNFPRRAEMRPYVGGTMARLENLANRLYFDCINGRASEVRLVPLAEALHREATSIARTEAEVNYAGILEAGAKKLREGAFSPGGRSRSEGGRR